MQAESEVVPEQVVLEQLNNQIVGSGVQLTNDTYTAVSYVPLRSNVTDRHNLQLLRFEDRTLHIIFQHICNEH